jgi:pyroglutamyl-peptidase
MRGSDMVSSFVHKGRGFVLLCADDERRARKMTVQVLATGFSVFPGAPENPSAWAVAELARAGWQPDGARLVTHTLPVRFDLWEREFAPLLARTKPDAVVAFGLSAKTTGVTLESTARNRVARDRPDFTGAFATAERAVAAGAEVLATRLPLADISVALRTADIPVVPSDDAGDYLCNLLFYRLIDFASANNLKVAGFVHVPYLDTQVARLAAAGHTLEYGATMSEAQLITAVKIIIECCTRAVKRVSQGAFET